MERIEESCWVLHRIGMGEKEEERRRKKRKEKEEENKEVEATVARVLNFEISEEFKHQSSEWLQI